MASDNKSKICWSGIWKSWFLNKSPRLRSTTTFLPQKVRRLGSPCNCWEGDLAPRTTRPLGVCTAQMLILPLQSESCACDSSQSSRLFVHSAVIKARCVLGYGNGIPRVLSLKQPTAWWERQTSCKQISAMKHCAAVTTCLSRTGDAQGWEWSASPGPGAWVES